MGQVPEIKTDDDDENQVSPNFVKPRNLDSKFPNFSHSFTSVIGLNIKLSRNFIDTIRVGRAIQQSTRFRVLELKASIGEKPTYLYCQSVM